MTTDKLNKKRPKFNVYPFRGVFREAATRLKVKGKHARTIVANRYYRGELRTVRIVNALVEERIAHAETSKRITERAAQFQQQEAV